MVDGLKALHQAGLIHGNLKLTNILLFYGEHELSVKIADHVCSPSYMSIYSTDRMVISTCLIQSPEYL